MQPLGMDVLLVTVDCLRPSHLGCHGYTSATSPTIDTLAAEGIVFENAVAQSSWTSPSLFSLLTGCNPPAHGVTSRGGRISTCVDALPATFRKAGWEVPNACYLNAEESYAALGWGPPEGLEAVLSTSSTRRRLIWTHYERCHLPYDGDREMLLSPRLEPLRREHVVPRGSIPIQPEDRAPIVGLYDAGVRALDAWLGTILGIWSGRGRVILTADHGEELLEHGWVGHTSTAEWPTLYEEVLRIPLILAGFGGPRRVAQRVRQIDVLPTLCELLEVPLPARVEGRSLVPLMRGHPLPDLSSYAETACGGYRTRSGHEPHRVRALHCGDWKLIESTLAADELYDLAADPAERVNVAPEHPERVETMRAELRATARASRHLWSAAGKEDACALTWTRCAEGVALTLPSDARHEIEYEVRGDIAGTLYANGPRVIVPSLLPGRFRARVLAPGGEDTGWSRWIDVAAEEQARA